MRCSLRTRAPRARRWTRLGACAVTLLWAVAASAEPLDQAIDIEVETNKDSAESQRKIDALSDDIDTMAAEYRSLLQEIRSLEVYNRQLERLIKSQEDEMASLRRQIDSVTVVSRGIMPLMLRMIDGLEKFVDLDVPFLEAERTQRVAALREVMDRADVALSEKYRRLMEAFQIESDYGRTIDAYRGSLDRGGTVRTVDFLQIGRNALLYQTLDGDEVGAWDQRNQRWVTLGAEYRSAIRKGLRMARKQVAPDLITVPVPAPEAVQ